MYLRKEEKTSQGTKPKANKCLERVSMHKKPGEIYEEIKGGLGYTHMLLITRRIASNRGEVEGPPVVFFSPSCGPGSQRGV